MHLYLAHYVTNEMLAAALATATLYLCLRLLKSDTPRVSQFAWLGLAMGAADRHFCISRRIVRSGSWCVAPRVG
jgi:hypothetical protein